MKTTFTTLLLLASLGTAHAAGPKPEDKTILGAKTVGVLPVLAVGLSRSASIQAITLASAAPTGGKAMLDPNKVAKVEATSGFGFAGSATSNDVKLLTYGFLMSTLALETTGTPEFTGQASRLGDARELLAPLSADVVKAVDRFIASGKEGRFDIEALAGAFDAAQRGIAAGPARGHGYLTAGLWTGLTVLAFSNNAVSPELAAMAPPLATMFDEDAQFEGADKKVAASLRELSALLGNSKLTAEIYTAALAKLFSIKEDAP